MCSSDLLMEAQRALVLDEAAPLGFEGNWSESVMNVSLLGGSPDFRIEGLEGPRSHCTEEGIGSADSILVPLEDRGCEGRIGLRILKVRELISFPEGLTRIPGMPDYIIGMFNLRGLVIPVMDLREKFEMTAEENF